MKRQLKRTVKIVLFGLAVYIYGYNKGTVDARPLHLEGENKEDWSDGNG